MTSKNTSPTWAGFSAFLSRDFLRFVEFIAVILAMICAKPAAAATSSIALPPALVNVPYRATVPAPSKNVGYIYSLVAGQLPSGTTLDRQAGVISGIPAQSGTSSFTLLAVSSTSQMQRDFFLTVTSPPPLAITTSSLPAASLSAAYSATLISSGGMAPFSWSVTSGQLPSGSQLSRVGVLSGVIAQTGQYPLQIQVVDAAGQRSSRPLALVVNPPSGGKGTTVSAGFSGMHINQPNTPWPSVPVGSVRLWDSGTGWAQIETASATYDWSVLDARVNEASAAGADVLYDFARTPPWAQCAPTNKSCGSGVTVTCSYNDGSSGPGQCYPPNDLSVDGSGSNQHWINWVTAVVTRYRTRIKFYEIWNEPDMPAMWQGTNPQLIRMEQDARCIVIGTGCNSRSHYTQTAIDPTALITTPAFTSTSGLVVGKAASAFLQAGGGAYADVIAFHGYLGQDKPAESVLNTIATLQNGLVAAGQQSKPVFDTEGSWGSLAWITDAGEQQAWLARYMILQQSAGVQRFYWYSWDSGAAALWSRANGISAAGTAHGQVSDWLTGATLLTPCTNVGTVWTCSYTKPGGYRSMTVWDAAQTCSAGVCTKSKFAVPVGYTYWQDLDGNKNHITTSAIAIGARPILLENQ